jgi:hypothetical protein
MLAFKINGLNLVSIAMLKQHDQTQLIEERGFWGVQRSKCPFPITARKYGSGEAWRLEAAKSLHLESQASSRKIELGISFDFQCSEPIPCHILPQAKPPKFPKTTSPAKDQVFKCQGL